MITNNAITYFHKTLNPQTRLEEWNKYSFNNVWVFGGKGSSINRGYENANDVKVRIPIKLVNDTSIFQLGDIVCIGEQDDISKQSDLKGKEFYNITSKNINSFGNNPHIHLGGK